MIYRQAVIALWCARKSEAENGGNKIVNITELLFFFFSKLYTRMERGDLINVDCIVSRCV